jgi:nitrite reductase/ring-hydroxylating ferredoxin subunit
MKDRRSVLIGMASVALSAVFPAAFAAGPTLKPTRLGQSIIWRGKKYTAIKRGKALVWDRGTSINIANEATPTPLPSSQSSKAVLQDIVLAKSSDVAIGETKKFTNGKSYFVARNSSGLLIFDDVCTHEGCAVEIKGSELQCPCHLATYSMSDGKVIKGPATIALRTYESKELAGNIIVVDYA